MHSGKVILITGGTGQVGTAAAPALLRRGWKVRVLTRDSSSTKADVLRTMGTDVVSGDLDGRESLHRAMAGVLGVFCVPPLVFRGASPEDASFNLAIEHAAAASRGKLTILYGGIPIVADGKIIGAVGVGGGVEQDVSVGKAGAAALETAVSKTHEHEKRD